MQLNIRADSQFIKELDALVSRSGLKTRTAAIKHAVHVLLQQNRKSKGKFDFHSLIGLAGKPNPKGRFKTDDELFEDMP